MRDITALFFLSGNAKFVLEAFFIDLEVKNSDFP